MTIGFRGQGMGIGEDYQQATKYNRETITAGRACSAPAAPFKHYPNAPGRIDVTAAPPPGDGQLWDVLGSRRSERDFSGNAIDCTTLSHLLFAAQGVTARAGSCLLRTAPSAGALYPVETYLLANRVTGLAPGIYHYNIVESCLESLAPGDHAETLTRAALGQSMVTRGCVTFLWTGIVGRSFWKYGERTWRYLYLDAGHIGQNLSLGAAALGLGCCMIGAFFDDEINRLLGVDGQKETLLYMGVVGTR